MPSDFLSQAGLPVINVSGCPIHPAWVAETIQLITAGKLTADDLDPLNRPRFYADKLVHHGCNRNEYYEFKASSVKPSDLGCMMENMGCVGTVAHADCNERPWNGNGSCTNGGYPCIDCTSQIWAPQPRLSGNPENRQHPRWLTHGYAESLVYCPLNSGQIRHAEAVKRKRNGRSYCHQSSN